MQPTRELIDELYREEVLRAREMATEDKFFAGTRLFELACSFTVAGIHKDHPDADSREVAQMLQARVDLARRLE
jgi:hypothetical protein